MCALSHLNPECPGFCFVHPPKMNCLAFSWNVAFPVSQGNVAINIITGIINVVNYYIAVYVGHAPCNFKADLYIGVFNNTVCISI